MKFMGKNTSEEPATAMLRYLLCSIIVICRFRFGQTTISVCVGSAVLAHGYTGQLLGAPRA